MALSGLASTKVILILICALFLFTRLYKIAEIPVSVYWDEASIGYNAYAVSTDLKDEWGKFMPIHFRAFGEFKLPVYIYSVAPFVKIFGLNAFSVRLPAVLYSLGVIILIYWLARKLTGSEQIGLWSSFLLTISPWFFIFSRTGYEVTAGLMFYLLGILFFLNMSKTNLFFLFSILSFTLSAFSYNSFRIISPLTLISLFLFNLVYLRQLIKKGKIYLFISCLVVIIAIIPIYRLYKYDAGGARLQVIGGISKQQMVKNYLSHFNPPFLFIQGDRNQRSQQSNFGQLFFPDLILLPLGLFYLLRSKVKNKWLILSLILLGPIPAAITKESPHALRSLSMVPFIHLVSAIGIVYLTQISHKKLSNLFFLGLFLILFGNYFYNFLTVFPKQSAEAWQNDYKQIFTHSLAKYQQNGKYAISDKEGQPYIFALFYLKYNPAKFRREVVRNPVNDWGFSSVREFANFQFTD